MSLIATSEGGDTPPDNEIWYWADEKINVSDSRLISNEFRDGKGILTFNTILTSTSPGWFSYNSSVKKIALPNSITTIGDYSFRICSNLEEITLSDSIVKIGTCGFLSCPMLRLEKLPAYLVTLGGEALYGCTSCSVSVLPASVLDVGVYVFYGCTGISSLTCYREEPCNLDGSAFVLTSFPIYVPASSVDVYKSASGWSSWASRIFPIPE